MDHSNQDKEYSIEEFKIALRENNDKRALEIFKACVKCDSLEWLNGYVPLCLAFKYCNFDIANKFLHSEFLKVNNDNQQKEYTPLHWAILHYHFTGLGIDVLDKLLKKGADINKENLLRQNAFDIALQKCNTSALWQLVRHANDNNLEQGTFFKVLLDFISGDYSDHAEELIKKCSCDINKFKTNLNLLLLAVEKKQYNVVKILLDRGIDVNYYNKFDKNSRTAIDKACEMGDLKMVKLLLDNRASTDTGVYSKSNYECFGPIHTATEKNHLNIVKKLLDHGENIDKALPRYGHSCMYTPLHMACESDHLEIAKLLIKRGANLYFEDKTMECSRTPIIEAFYSDDGKVFEYILSLNNFRLTLHDAKLIAFCSAGTDGDYCKKFDLFFKYIEKFNSKDHLRYSLDVEVFNNTNLKRPLIHHAARHDSSECIKLLIRNGIDVNLKNSKGRTALHVAFRYRKLRAIWSLIKKGADINLKCNDGHFPVDFTINDSIRKSRYETDEDKDDENRSNRNRDEWDLEEIAEYYGYYVIKLKFLNLFVNNDNYRFVINNLDNPFEFQEEYEREVEEMKEENISAEIPDITYYNFIKGSLNRRIHFISYQQISTVLNDEKSYCYKFTEFAPIISNLFHQALARKNLLDKCDPFFVTLCKHLPYLCVQEIISYFTNNDLRNLFNKFNFE